MIEVKCHSKFILEEYREVVKNLAKIIAMQYLAEGRYSVVDRLATSISPSGVKFALYEILRGIDREKIPSKCMELIEKLLEDLDNPICQEDALSAAKTIAVLALSQK